MNKFEYKNLTPFKWFVLENFPFIEADFDALTEWQLFCKLGKEMNKIINSENTLGTQMENVTNAFIELQNYVNNYFENLDVQEEINNKLNEMAEDGTLQEIIGKYFKEINNKIEQLENKLENNINEMEDEIKINGKSVELANNITYDLPSEYNDWYSQGIAIKGDILYIYIEKNNTGKLLSFNYKEYTYIGEYNINLHHANDLTIINGIMYVASCYDKNLICIDLNNFNVTSLTLEIAENYISGIAKYDNDNLIILAANDFGSNFSNCNYYLYNLTNNTLTSLTLESDILINFYAVQGMTSKDGYLYQIVSNPDQILKAKIDTTNNKIKFISIYNLPEKDNLGLLIGEYEGIDFIDNNNMLISSHILDDFTTGRTIKTYYLNLKNGIPTSLKHYPNTNIIEKIEDIEPKLYLDKGKNLNIYYENGTQNFPFKTLARAVNYSLSNNIYAVNVYNNDTNATNNIIYSMFVIPNNTHITFNIVANNIEIDFARILGSDIQFDSSEVPNTNSFVKILDYSGSERWGNIVNSNVSFMCNLNIIKRVDIRNSIIKDMASITSTLNPDDAIFRLRNNTIYYASTNWINTNSNNIYFLVHAGATLFILNILSNQSTWYRTHVINNNSTSFNVIFGGVHYSA